MVEKEELLPPIEKELPPEIDMEIMQPEKEQHISNDPLIDNFDDIINIATSTKEINTSIPKNITQAFKCDESESWIKSTLREVQAMIENEVWIVPKSIPKDARLLTQYYIVRKKM